ncbi:hypothetical protein CF328_g3486 [Tilletia controversa]|nr:hypothetical protein CF328_g3486 [Tilletia controversa]
MTRTMLIAANLPTFFWPAAVETAVRIKNRVTASGLKEGKTPHEMLFGKPPAPEDFRPFGCVAWAKKASTERHGKFDPKARPCVYLGPAFRGASRLWDPATEKEIIEHSVIFDDHRDASALVHPGQQRTTDAPGAGGTSTRPAPAQAAPAASPASPSAASPAALPPGQPAAVLVRAMQTVLEKGIVPDDVVDSARTIAGGNLVSPRTLSTLTTRLRERTDQIAQGAAGEQPVREGAGQGAEGGRSGEVRSAGGHQVSEGDRVQTQAAEREDQERGSEGRERRSGRIAGEEPQFGMLSGGRKRKEPGDACLAVLDPEDVGYDDPRTVSEALRRPDREAWLTAMNVEIRSHKNRGTWRVVKRRGQNLVTSKWVLRLKKNADGSIQKYKTRLVARGFTQIEGFDFDETFAPTSRLQNMRLLLANAVALNMDVHQIDYETAYLNAKLQTTSSWSPPKLWTF